MIYKVYTVFDSKIDEFLPPFFTKTLGEAQRVLQQICSDPNQKFSKYPMDFSFHELGTYDDSTGHMESLAAPVILGVLSEYCSSNISP